MTEEADKDFTKSKPILENTPENQQRLKRGQIKLFIISYLAYSCVHFQREFWSLSKRQIIIDPELGELLTKEVLSEFDGTQLLVYAITMYVSGVLGDTYNQRKILTIAFFGYGLFTAGQAIGGLYNIESKLYYFVVFGFLGLFNSCMFPTFISILANWFTKERRGFAVGLWATCNNVGNIFGIQLAASLLYLLNGSWTLLMFFISIVLFLQGFVIYFFIIPEPEEVGIIVHEPIDLAEIIEDSDEIATQDQTKQQSDNLSPDYAINREADLSQRLLSAQQKQDADDDLVEPQHDKFFFLKAWLIPGVFLYSSTFFCMKLAVYTMLLWLQLYLASLYYTTFEGAWVSTLFDVGAILGSMTLGYLSDRLYQKRSPVAFIALLCAITVAYSITFLNESISKAVFFMLMFFLGFFMYGINNLVQASCAADIGKHQASKSHQKSTTTVIGIIDASGALGASFGQYLIGATQEKWGWVYGFWLVISIDITIALIPLSIIMKREIHDLIKIRKQTHHLLE